MEEVIQFLQDAKASVVYEACAILLSYSEDPALGAALKKQPEEAARGLLRAVEREEDVHSLAAWHALVNVAAISPEVVADLVKFNAVQRVIVCLREKWCHDVIQGKAKKVEKQGKLTAGIPVGLLAKYATMFLVNVTTDAEVARDLAKNHHALFLLSLYAATGDAAKHAHKVLIAQAQDLKAPPAPDTYERSTALSEALDSVGQVLLNMTATGEGRAQLMKTQGVVQHLSIQLLDRRRRVQVLTVLRNVCRDEKTHALMPAGCGDALLECLGTFLYPLAGRNLARIERIEGVHVPGEELAEAGGGEASSPSHRAGAAASQPEATPTTSGSTGDDDVDAVLFDGDGKAESGAKSAVDGDAANNAEQTAEHAAGPEDVDRRLRAQVALLAQGGITKDETAREVASDLLVALCRTKEGRSHLKSSGFYEVLRLWHLEENNVNTCAVINDIVNIIKTTEADLEAEAAAAEAETKVAQEQAYRLVPVPAGDESEALRVEQLD